MITLNDYLYNGDTVLRIIQKYSRDLKNASMESGNSIDMFHSNFLLHLEELLEHNDFLTSQSQRIREFYKYMTSCKRQVLFLKKRHFIFPKCGKLFSSVCGILFSRIYGCSSI